MEVLKGQSGYDEWNNRGVNLRFSGTPDFIVPVSSIEELMKAVNLCLEQNKYFVIRGGGHCLENFTANPSVQTIIDISQMKGVSYDPSRNAIKVAAGETVGQMLKKMHDQWGILLPVGEHPDIGMGGHIAGGAFGWLCRQLGLGVDYLDAIEVITVDHNRKLRKYIASNKPNDPNYELWWAHTGGGTGNFGIVTAYWFKMPTVATTVPSNLLPAVPKAVETIELEWSWNYLNEETFVQLLHNFGEWTIANSSPDSYSKFFFGTMHLFSVAVGKIQLKGLVTDSSKSEPLVKEFLKILNQNLAIKCEVKRTPMSWLDFALKPFPDIFYPGKMAFKVKDGFLYKPFTNQQALTIYHYLTGWKHLKGIFVGIATYGGQVNAVDVDTTATVQRRAIFTTSCTAGWAEPEESEAYMSWVREAYQTLWSDQGGAPVPGSQAGGCIIAHPDNDLADPQLNTSGTPWHTFYYQQHYSRLQQIKLKYDPLNIFHHALSIEPAPL